MFIELRNVPRDYAWGAPGAISAILGADGACRSDRGADAPEAELWLGAHPGSPARVLERERSLAQCLPLDEWIAKQPERALGRYAAGLHDDRPVLPFLLKVLAAAEPLSLQTHPSLAQAAAGFAAEEARGVPIDAPERSYRDPLHKPELLLAVSERFRALAGFRPIAESVHVFSVLAEALNDDTAAVIWNIVRELRAIETAGTEWGLKAIVRRLLEWGANTPLVLAVTAAANALQGAGHLDEQAALAVDTVERLSSRYPGDPGIAIALLLNRLELQAGEAIFLEAGTLHAYLEGVGLEIMAGSDNVLRGGLTPKHIDIPELLNTLDARILLDPRVTPRELDEGLIELAPGVPDFRLLVMTSERERSLALDGPAIALALHGDWRLDGDASGTVLGETSATFITPDEGRIRMSGEGQLIIATTDPAARGDRPQ